MNAVAIRQSSTFRLRWLLLLALLLFVGFAFSEALRYPTKKRDDCRPFTIGVSAIGGPDPIEGCLDNASDRNRASHC